MDNHFPLGKQTHKYHCRIPESMEPFPFDPIDDPLEKLSKLDSSNGENYAHNNRW